MRAVLALRRARRTGRDAARAAGVAPRVLLPAGLLLAQGLVFWLLPAHGAAAAYVAMVAAPLLAAAAALWRGRREHGPARTGWLGIALAMATWACGAFANLWHELILGRQDEMYRDAILAFNLALVPMAFVLAGEWVVRSRRLPRIVDALLALGLGFGYFLVTWATLTARGAPDADGVQTMLWLMDLQNGVVALGALIRWCAAGDAREREVFRALAAYTVGYLVIAFVNNHFIAANPAFGPQLSSVVTIAFALVAGLALAPPALAAAPPWRPGVRLGRAVHSASPLLLAGALLIVSLFLIRVDYGLGVAGVLVAVLGHGLRSTAVQVRHIEREDSLQRDRRELQAIAWTDALTGVANRRFLDQALDAAWRLGLRAGQPLAVLMIDIDHFKQLNDRDGHAAGDACLRRVAQALRGALVRPADALARYGGEEFCALLHDTDAAGARVVAERLRGAVRALAIANPDSPLRTISVSIGCASALPAPRGDVAALVGAADKALYAAKCAGRDQVHSATA